MRIINYERTELHGDNEPVENDLLSFVYDVPYFGACGIFPPFKIANSIFLSGGGDGGMSPGAIWSPFDITEDEYKELVEGIKKTSLKDISKKVRYGDIKFEFDPDFDHIQDHIDWLTAVCNKHLENYHKKL